VAEIVAIVNGSYLFIIYSGNSSQLIHCFVAFFMSL